MVRLLILLLLTGDPLDRSWSFDEDPLDNEPRRLLFRHHQRPARRAMARGADGDQRGAGATGQESRRTRLALAVVKGVEVKGRAAVSKIKVVSGEEEQSGGIVWRYRNSENYLVARIDPDEKNVRLYRVVDGNRVSSAAKTTVSSRSTGGIRCGSNIADRHDQSLS